MMEGKKKNQYAAYMVKKCRKSCEIVLFQSGEWLKNISFFLELCFNVLEIKSKKIRIQETGCENDDVCSIPLVESPVLSSMIVTS